MNFLLDAQLPRRLTYLLREAGHDALHTLDLSKGNRTPDREINDLSLRESRVVVTKDSDFVDSFLISHRPYKLLLVSTGNITNAELEALFDSQMPSVVRAFESLDYVELTRNRLILHQ